MQYIFYLFILTMWRIMKAREREREKKKKEKEKEIKEKF